jgi:hypothetical protein
MHTQFTSINIIFVCLLVLIGVIIDNKIEAGAVGKNSLPNLLSKRRPHTPVGRKLRAILDEANNDDLIERSNGENDAFGEEDMVDRFNNDENEQSEENEDLGERDTDNDEENTNLNNEFKERFLNSNDEDFENRILNDDDKNEFDDEEK